LFFKWGINFDEANPYTIKDKGARPVAYVSKPQIEDDIVAKFPPLPNPKAAHYAANDRRMPSSPDKAGDDGDGGGDMLPRKRNVGSGQRLKT